MSRMAKDKEHLVSQRFFDWLKSHGVSQRKYCSVFSVSEQAICNWRKDGIPASRWAKVAEIMGYPVEVLTSKPGEVDVVTDKVVLLPLIDSVHASNWQGMGDQSFDEFIPVMTKCSKDSFCLKVEGPSMEPVFKEGDIVVVDPAVTPTPGRYVVAIREGESMSTVKKYRALGVNEYGNDVFEIAPENPNFASYRSDRTAIKISGVVVSAIRNF